MNRMASKRIDFYSAYNKKPAMSGKKQKKLKLLAPLIALLAVFCVILGGFFIKLCVTKSRLSEELSYASDPSVIAKYDEYKKLDAKKTDLLVKLDTMRTTRQALSTFPAIDSKLFEKVEASCGKTVVESYEYTEETAVFQILGSSAGVENVANFAQKLEQLGIFDNIGYTGYFKGGADGPYQFTISCICKGSEISKDGDAK
ncbi:MAG: hypothetical protein RSE36_00920 [Oscillospiraceae bacterium]